MGKLPDEERLVTRGELVDALNVLMQDYPTKREMVAVVNEGLRKHDVRHHRSWWRRLRDWSALWLGSPRRERRVGLPPLAPLVDEPGENPHAAPLLVPDTRLVGLNGEPL